MHETLQLSEIRLDWSGHRDLKGGACTVHRRQAHNLSDTVHINFCLIRFQIVITLGLFILNREYSVCDEVTFWTPSDALVAIINQTSVFKFRLVFHILSASPWNIRIIKTTKSCPQINGKPPLDFVASAWCAGHRSAGGNAATPHRALHSDARRPWKQSNFGLLAVHTPAQLHHWQLQPATTTQQCDNTARQRRTLPKLHQHSWFRLQLHDYKLSMVCTFTADLYSWCYNPRCYWLNRWRISLPLQNNFYPIVFR